jgi:hypothetical protein
MIIQEALDFAKGKDWFHFCNCPVAGYYFICSEQGLGENVEVSDLRDSQGIVEITKFIPSEQEKNSLGIQGWDELYLFENFKGDYKVLQTLE